MLHGLHGTGIFTYISHKFKPNPGKYAIHGAYGMLMDVVSVLYQGNISSTWGPPNSSWGLGRYNNLTFSNACILGFPNEKEYRKNTNLHQPIPTSSTKHADKNRCLLGLDVWEESQGLTPNGLLSQNQGICLIVFLVGHRFPAVSLGFRSKSHHGHFV